MKPSKTHLLAELCRRGAAGAPAKVTTTDLAKSLGASQQTISRWLGELSAEGLVSRNGKNARLTRAAREEIQALAAALEAKLAKTETGKEKLVLRGVVVRGLGEGAKFMRLPGYAKQLRAALGWTPFPGTLNLKLDAESAKMKSRLESMGGVKVKSFVERNQRFGSVKLFQCAVKSKGGEARGAVILPEESFYGESVLEAIAPFNLRSHLAAKDGAAVAVKILGFE